MNKISKLLLGVAVVSLASCSNDEPAPAPVTDGEGTTLYLNVNIRSANASSRAEGDDPEPGYVEGDYADGTLTGENTIDNAWFLFYNVNGNYQFHSNGFVDVDGNDMPNVEYMGANTLVLRNVKENAKPRYMLTILNAPQDLIDKVQNEALTLEQTGKLLTDIRADDLFIMSTSSYFAEEKETKFDAKYYYANVLDETDFMLEPKETIGEKDPVVNIFVERLAAKFTIEGLKGNIFPVPVTIAGLDNETIDETVTDATELYVKILGFGLTGQEEESYLSKNIEGFNTAAPWEESAAESWNLPAYHRSFWAKSPSYGTDAAVKYIGFDAAQNDVTTPLYGFETTNTLENLKDANGKLIQSKVTNIIFAAQVFKDKECTQDVDFIQFGSRYYTQEYFKRFVLARLNATGSLNYWKKTGSTTVNGEDGYTSTHDEYAQVSENDFEYVKNDDGKTGTVKIHCTLANDTELYICKNDPSDKSASNWELIEATEAGLTAVQQLEAAVTNYIGETKLSASTDGATFYSVPIEHLLGKNQKKDYKVTAEGEYGIVRNHWYQLTIGAVFRLGNAVFEPGIGEGNTKTEPLIPDDPNEDSYALAAQINILSWKILTQEADL